MYITDEWIAGFVEGDGCFSKNVQQKGRYKYPKIEVHQKNLEPLEAMVDYGWKVTTNGRLHVAYCVGRNAQRIYDRISPWLSSRRISQAQENLFVHSATSLPHSSEWFAGYYEAEGCVYAKTNGQTRKDGTRKKFAGLSVTQYSSEETSRFCLSALSRGRVAGPYLANGQYRAYSFNISGQEAIKTVESIGYMLSEEKMAQLQKVKEQTDYANG